MDTPALPQGLFPFFLTRSARATRARGRRRRSGPSLRGTVGVLGALLATAAPAFAQDTRPDQVNYVDRRSGSVVTASGTVTQNQLDGVVIDDRKLAPADVRRIAFGSVPDAYREATILEDRGDLANAAAKFKLVAADDDARDVVRAEARLRAAETLLLHGAADPSAFADADTAATRFLEEHAQNREVPRARFVQAQARLASGDAASAAELFRALYREASANEPTPGYDRVLCLRAGLRGADAYLMAGESLPAREIYQAIDATLPGIIAGLAEENDQRRALLEIQTEARLGEGFVLLANGSAGQARSFFEQHALSPETPPAERFGVQLGLGLVNLAEGKLRSAQLDLATVSGVDYTDRDRTARALIGLAEATMKLPDDGATARARTWLECVRDQYPDSIWVAKAQELHGQL